MIIKNSNLRRDLFSNRYKLLWIIIAIILILCLIQVINKILKQQQETKVEEKTVQEQTKTSVNKESSYNPEETVIQGENVSEIQQEANTKVIDDFINYCNAKQIEDAYNLLTKETQEIFFKSDINKFSKDYVEKIFTTKKMYTMQSWMQSSVGYTYKVKIMEDILATGNVGQAIEGYYTIVRQNDNYKLNLNNYIGKQDINETKQISNITITVISKKYFMEYETYEIKVENNTDKTIILDSKQNLKSVYLTGNNGTTYTGYMFEIDEVLLKLKPGLYRTYNIRFNKRYDAKTIINSITFSDIIEDEEEYSKMQDKTKYENRKTIKVDM